MLIFNLLIENSDYCLNNYLTTNNNPNLNSNMARAMFEYTKTILKKVSFDYVLFCRELKKAVKRLLPFEIEELKDYILSLSETNPELENSLIYLNE